jgi:hypothetical protein
MTELGPGDKVLTLKERLTELERRVDVLSIGILALVVLNLPQLGPLGDWLGQLMRVAR